ncbi:hypothetical protein GCM10009641_25610 [Mycobacterium cookii]|uniref:Uncharacterized protein n=1 Tax=Mycobacterium cookii TaxID=1775 RepID=A0A7I7KSN5_9MYCO|nr:hypothetical protein MCOO_08620 [Mycobacterium cookii]
MWEPPLQCPQQTTDFVDASTYLGQLSGIARVSVLVAGHPARKLLKFGALGLQKPLKHSRLSFLGRLSGAAGQNACCT